MFKPLRRLSLLRPLEARSFRLLWAGEGLSLLADQVFIVVLTLLVSRITGTGVELGAVLAVASVPGALLMPLGGVLSDRFSPAGVMVCASVGRAVLLATVAGLVLTDAVALWHLYAIGGALSAFDALYYPASLSIVPTLVHGKRLGAANALVQGAEQASGIAGPALAAASVSAFGIGTTFAAEAFVFCAAAVAFTGVLQATKRTSFGRRVADQDAGEEPVRPASLPGLMEGVRYAWRDPVIRGMLLVLAAINLAAIGPLVVGGAALAEQRLGGTAAFGIFLSAFGGGSLIGVVLAGSVRRARYRGLTVLGVAMVFGLGLVALGFVPGLSLALAVAATMGVGSGYLGVVLVAWLQESVEAGMRGRVMSLVVFAVVALDPVSYALAGAAMELGLTVTFVSAGALMLLIAVLFGVTSRAVLEFD